MIEYAVLLAGGEGTRLRPFTHYTSKHLLPVNDKPMIFYPLKNLILLGVKNVCIVINPKHYDQWKMLLNNLELNINIELVIQDSAEGIPHALKLCEKYIRQRDHFLALGDNILIGPEMMKNFSNIVEKKNGAAIIGYPVKNTQDFGVAEFNNNGKLLKVIEKPTKTKSNLAVVGLYKFDADVFSMFDQLQKSKRDEYEIADIINIYIKKEKCSILKIESPANYWLDTGSVDRIISASNFIRELSKAGNIDFADIKFR